MNASRARVTTGKASLIGGIVLAIASLVLWTAATRELGLTGMPVLVLGVLISAGAGLWTRLADL